MQIHDVSDDDVLAPGQELRTLSLLVATSLTNLATEMRQNADADNPEGCTFLDQLNAIHSLVEKATDIYESW